MFFCHLTNLYSTVVPRNAGRGNHLIFKMLHQLAMEGIEFGYARLSARTQHLHRRKEEASDWLNKWRE
jgi:hypothetical protein